MNPCMPTIAPFTAPFAVCKVTVAPGRKRPDVWAGYLADRAKGKVVWDDGSSTTYGPSTTEDPSFYSLGCLAEDMADGRFLYEAVQRLLSGGAPPASSPGPSLFGSKAIEAAVKCYGKTPNKKQRWLTWLEGCIQASNNTGKRFNCSTLTLLNPKPFSFFVTVLC